MGEGGRGRGGLRSLGVGVLDEGAILCESVQRNLQLDGGEVDNRDSACGYKRVGGGRREKVSNREKCKERIVNLS